MSRFFLHISYDGTDFEGWQSQLSGNTVQDFLNRALCMVFNLTEIETTGCGRTDSGVHASSFYLHFDLDQEIVDSNKVIRSLNGILPSSIACSNLIAMAGDAHARFDAVLRTYHYHIHKSKNPFKTKFSNWLVYDLNLDLMNEAGNYLLTQTDFAAFSKSGSDTRTSICKLYEAEWKESEENSYVFRISADRFLRNMVRSIVGTMVDLGRGKMDLNEFKSIVQSGKRSEAGTSVPASGLFLTNIKYPYL